MELAQRLRLLPPVALGQQVADVALLVAVAPMHERSLAEHVLDRPADRLSGSLRHGRQR